ncbi:hypothetical protein, partial [Bacillus cereus]|uniref:hypothetical protein n=1 Tax=Bacillus cereus TaxID=1396 RepID=UPI000BF3CF33
MKKVTNKMMSALCMTSILFSVGCTGTQETKKESVEQKGSDKQKVADTEIGKEKVIQDKKMKITAAKMIKDETVGEQEELIQVKFDIKNEGKEDFGIGAGDFLLKDKEGKTYTMYGREDNFGNVI